MAQSLLDYTVPASPPPPTGGGPIAPGPYSQLTASAQISAGGTAGAPVGTPPLTGVHNSSLHVALWGVGALGIILLMHTWGFRLVSVGRYGGR